MRMINVLQIGQPFGIPLSFADGPIGLDPLSLFLSLPYIYSYTFLLDSFLRNFSSIFILCILIPSLRHTSACTGCITLVTFRVELRTSSISDYWESSTVERCRAKNTRRDENFEIDSTCDRIFDKFGLLICVGWLWCMLAANETK